jgi:small subunit ribosomal protein S16
MLTIRLQRVGKKKIASYRLVISEKARDTQDRYLELLGTYNPHAKENQFLPIAERILYWISKGAETSPTVHNLLVNAGILKAKKVKAVYLSKKRHAKIAEKSASKKAATDKKAAAEAAPAPEVAPQA